MLSKFSSLQLDKSIDLFEEIKNGIQRNIPEQHFHRICMKIFFSDCLNLSSAITCVLKKATHCMEYKSENLLSTGKSESYMNGQYVAGIEPSHVGLERQDARKSFIFVLILCSLFRG